jgi:C-terminal processing protease CtpA/Prc
MESNYPGRSKATVWPWIGCLVLLGCASPWGGSIGAVLAKSHRDGRLYVRDAPPDMGAAKAGIQPGDEVTAVNGKPVLDMSPEDIHKALIGAVGTKVQVTVLRDGESVTHSVERGPLRGE